MNRRDLLKLAAAAPILGSRAVFAKEPPAAPVAISKVPAYSEDLVAAIEKMFDQIGGAGRLVKNKTVAIKLNLTGSPGNRFQGRPLGATHYTHPRTIMAMIHALNKAGASRIRLLEGCFATSAPLQEFMLDSGWNVRQMQGLAKVLEFENTNIAGKSGKYARFMVPGKGYIYPGYDLNHSWQDTDVVMSMAKLKNHATCGVTLSMKNMFGITPISIYGDDAGKAEPNENPSSGRGAVCHAGKRQPAASAPQEIAFGTVLAAGRRIPRIVAELNAARPVDIAFIEGIETVTGGEGPWVGGLKFVKPGVMMLGTNAVNADAVATAVMGYDPRASKGKIPFAGCDNHLLLAEALGVGSADLKRIEVVGTSIADAKFDFGPNSTPAV